MQQHRIVFATAGGPHPWIIANALIDRFGAIDVIVEAREPRSALIRRRIRKFGYANAAGQFAMMAWGVLSKRLVAPRIERLIAGEGLKASPPDGQSVIAVPSVNAPQFLAEIRRLKPDLLFLAGCRILKPEVLAAIPCPVLNYHAGINPKYRGMNGGYWALASGDPENFGTTVHLVDSGVDTGGTLYQMRGQPGPEDDYATYALRQAAMSRGICVRAAEDVLNGRHSVLPSDLPSKLWYHPTIWAYVWTGLTRGVW